MAEEIKETVRARIWCLKCGMTEEWPLEAFRLSLRFLGTEITSAFLEIPDVYCPKCHVSCKISVEKVVYD